MVEAEEIWNLYDNPHKTVFVDWIKEDIEGGYIQFDTEEHKVKYLAGIDSLYKLRDAQKWSDCAQFIRDVLMPKTDWMTSENQRCQCNELLDATASAYDYSNDDMVIKQSDESNLRDALQEGNECLIIICQQRHHATCDKRFTHYSDCTTVWEHFHECSTAFSLEVQYP